MTLPDPSRRDNGLTATDWGALVDLDPRLSTGLLDRLAEAGVAAYVEPAAAVDTIHRAVTMPDRPLDRLWVDPVRAEAARTVVAGLYADLLAGDEPAEATSLVRAVPRGSARRVLTPPHLDPPRPTPPRPPGEPAEPDPATALDDDEVFRQIVAGFDRTATEPVGRWPVQEDADPAGPVGDQDPPAAADRPCRRRDHREDSPDLPDYLEPEALEPDPEEEHFVPPPPPPLRRLRPRTVAAVVGIVLGLLLTFAPDLVGLRSGNDTRLLGMVLLATGAGAIVWWMHDGAADDGPDEGAIV